MSTKTRKTLSRKALGIAIVGFFIVMPFSGCIGQEKVERVLRIGHDHEPTFMDPALFTWTADHAILSNIYSYLIGFEPGTFNMIGDLAKEVPTIENGLMSPDGKTIKFELRTDAKWHPGIPGTPHEGKDYGKVTAHDVVFTIERNMGLHDLAPGDVIYGMLYKNVDYVEATDDYTVVIHMKEVDVGLLWALAPYRNGAIVHKEAIEDYGAGIEGEYFKWPIGSGPFKFDHWTENEEFVIVKNEDYYGKEPWLDKIVYIPYEDENVRYTALEAGDIDIASPMSLKELWDETAANPDLEITSRVGLGNRGISFNFEWEAPDGRKPLSDVRVRRAIAHATEKETTIPALLVDTPAVGFLNPGYAGSIYKEEDFPPEYLYPYDIEKSKKLLAEAGYPDGIDLIFHTVTLPPLDILAPVYKEQWAKAGIRIEIVLEETSAWYERMVIKADYCVGWLPLGARPPESIVILTTIFHSVKPGEPYGLNFAKYNNSETDALIDQAAVTVDTEARYELYRQIQINLMRDLPVYPYTWEMTWLANNKKVKNIYVDLFNAHGDWMEEIVIEEG
ncbi:MAG: ABC transporter substrate-binding protein [Candidatus Heimdallarchaeota archaeon]